MMNRKRLTLIAAGLALLGSGCSEDNDEPCSGGSFICTGDCITIIRDELNCGGCDLQCEAGEQCLDGNCVIACGPGTALCEDRCVDFAIDPQNCGACANVCGSSQACSGGECVDGCPAGLTQCTGGCVRIETDPNHCGACANRCGPGAVCVDEQCVCPSDLTQCGEACVNTSTSTDHCGGCFNVCPLAGEVCQDSTCTCPSGNTLCPGTGCKDLQNDPFNCNVCGESCGAEEACVEGTCTDIVQCDSVSSPAPSCDVFPIDFGACGVVTATTTATSTSFSTEPGVGVDLSLALPSLQANQQVVADMLYTGLSPGGSAFIHSFRNQDDQVIPPIPSAVLAPQNSAIRVPIVNYASRVSVAKPARFVSESGAASAVVGDILINELSGRVNTGSIQLDSATPLAGPDLCTQVCGFAVGLGSDSIHAYRVEIPAKGHLDISMAARSLTSLGVIVRFRAYRADNLDPVCNPFIDRSIGSEWNISDGRITNNLNRPLSLVVSQQAATSQFHMSLSVSGPR